MGAKPDSIRSSKLTSPKVSCANNELSSLNLSNNSDLTSVICSSNQLSSLNVKNGNNGILETFYTRNNPNLTCIEIDNESNIGDSWEKDETASYVENCHYSETYVPDDNFEAALSTILGEGTNNNDNYISKASIEVLTSLDISNRSITDLTGIQDFEALSSFNVSGNLIDSLDVSENTKLVSLFCSNTQIDSLFLGNNSALENLDISFCDFRDPIKHVQGLKKLRNLNVSYGKEQKKRIVHMVDVVAGIKHIYSEPLLPVVDADKVVSRVKELYPTLTPSEKKRNVFIEKITKYDY